MLRRGNKPIQGFQREGDASLYMLDNLMSRTHPGSRNSSDDVSASEKTVQR